MSDIQSHVEYDNDPVELAIKSRFNKLSINSDLCLRCGKDLQEWLSHPVPKGNTRTRSNSIDE